jgi:hypothetical protein
MPPEAPPGFHDAISATVEIDNPNWLDWTIERIDAKIYDIETGAEIGQGILEDVPLYAREVQRLTIPFKVNYTADTIDTTTLRFASVCKENKTLDYRVEAEMTVRNLKTVTVEKLVPMSCPWELILGSQTSTDSTSQPAPAEGPAAETPAAETPAAETPATEAPAA